MKLVIFSLVVFFTFGCEENRIHSVLTKDDSNGVIHTIIHDGEIVATVSVDSFGNLISIVNDLDTLVQFVSYHPSTQYVLGKAMKNQEYSQEGVAYFFNENDELLHSVFQYENDKRVKDGFSFYDGMNMVKQFSRFDSTGSIVFRRTYDEYGNHTLTESKSPND